MAIHSEFSHWELWFSIAMLNYQRVSSTCLKWKSKIITVKNMFYGGFLIVFSFPKSTNRRIYSWWMMCQRLKGCTVDHCLSGCSYINWIMWIEARGHWRRNRHRERERDMNWSWMHLCAKSCRKNVSTDPRNHVFGILACQWPAWAPTSCLLVHDTYYWIPLVPAYMTGLNV